MIPFSVDVSTYGLAFYRFDISYKLVGSLNFDEGYFFFWRFHSMLREYVVGEY